MVLSFLRGPERTPARERGAPVPVWAGYAMTT